GGRLVCPGDAEWPSQLDDLGDRRPYALWVRGDQDLRFSCLRSVAIVGSRSATSYAVNVAAEIGGELAARKWTVVSGGAFGIAAPCWSSLGRGPGGRPSAVTSCCGNGVRPSASPTPPRSSTWSGSSATTWRPRNAGRSSTVTG